MIIPRPLDRFPRSPNLYPTYPGSLPAPHPSKHFPEASINSRSMMLTKQFCLTTGQPRVDCAKPRGATSNPSAEPFQTIQGATKSRIWCSGKAAPSSIHSLKQHSKPYPQTDRPTDRTCKILVHSNSNSAGCKCAFGAMKHI